MPRPALAPFTFPFTFTLPAAQLSLHLHVGWRGTPRGVRYLGIRFSSLSASSTGTRPGAALQCGSAGRKLARHSVHLNTSILLAPGPVGALRCSGVDPMDPEAADVGAITGMGFSENGDRALTPPSVAGPGLAHTHANCRCGKTGAFR